MRSRAAWADAAWAPVDGSSLRFFRVAFGLLVAASSLRFVAAGWVQRCFGEPTYFFTYWGFEWVRPLPAPGMTAAYLVLAALGALVASGRFFRPAAVALFVLFTWIELTDVTNYLNHYYLVSLLAALLAVSPATATRVPAGVLWLFRAQLAVVYLYAAVAKMSADWLLHGQPLGIWLSSRTEIPAIGWFFRYGWVALSMSWAGLLHDLAAPVLLGWRHTRLAMYAVIVVFHAATGMLFAIGIFPLLMILSTPLFFEPDWPRRWALTRRIADIGVRESPGPTFGTGPRRAIAVAAVTCVAFQALFPARAVFYGTDVNWHEQGMRWSWRVMCRAKTGSVTYTVEYVESGRRVLEFPASHLTALQEREFAGQPDLIVQLGQHLGRVHAARSGEPVRVYADALVSWNGRPPAPLVDPTVDLMTVAISWAPAPWILPAPEGPPPRLAPRPVQP